MRPSPMPSTAPARASSVRPYYAGHGSAPRPRRRTGRSGSPADRVPRVERAPDRHARLRGHAGRLHDRPDVWLCLLYEGPEALLVGPLVDGHELAVRAVPAMRDEPVALRDVHDAPDRVGLGGDRFLEPRRIPAHPHRHDHRHGSSTPRWACATRPTLSQALRHASASATMTAAPGRAGRSPASRA